MQITAICSMMGPTDELYEGLILTPVPLIFAISVRKYDLITHTPRSISSFLMEIIEHMVAQWNANPPLNRTTVWFLVSLFGCL